MLRQKDNIINDNDVIKINGEYVDKMKIAGEIVYKFTETTEEKPPTTILPTAVSIDQGTSITLKKNNTMQLTATITPADATDKTITWTSSSPTVIAISQTGVITGIAVGMATITAKTSNNITKAIIARVTS